MRKTILLVSLLLSQVSFSQGLRLLRDDAFEPQNLIPATGIVESGSNWYIELNQTKPLALMISGDSKYQGAELPYVGGDYSLYCDIQCQDGSMIWGVNIPFENKPSEDGWEHKELKYIPSKPVKSISFHCLCRIPGASAIFRNPSVRISSGDGFSFDGTLVTNSVESPAATSEYVNVKPRYYLRDIVADGDWVIYDSSVRDFKISTKSKRKNGVTFDETVITSLSETDRCITFVLAFPLGEDMEYALEGLDGKVSIKYDEVANSDISQVGNKRLTRVPVQGVGNENTEVWIALDPEYPAFCRTFFNSVTRELCIAYDLGFVKGNSEWKLKNSRFSLPSGSGFRHAWKQYASIYPFAFEVRTPKMGNWMHNAPIAGVERWQDFGFAFKTGNMTVSWDDANDIMSFRYTEPLTWWMPFEIKDAKIARNEVSVGENGVEIGSGNENYDVLEQGAAEARRLAACGDERAMTWEKSVMYDASNRPYGKWLDTPWCRGIVWSMSELPGLCTKEGDPTASYGQKWHVIYTSDLYPFTEKASRPVPAMWIDGEYTDSSEGYITIEMDFRREHLEAARTPLTFSLEDKKPVVFKGLTSFEYIRGISTDAHSAARLMFANATPQRYWFLAPMLDVMGTETDWRWTGDWHPLEIEEMQYKRMICYGKPFCFIQNTDFSKFSSDMSLKYIQRCVAFGMFPGYFSKDAFNGHFFLDPALYEPVRNLFRQWMPICKELAELGWEPVTGIGVSDKRLLVERFGDYSSGDESCLVTVYNPSSETIEISFDSISKEYQSSPMLVKGSMTLAPECVSVFRLFQR